MNFVRSLFKKSELSDEEIAYDVVLHNRTKLQKILKKVKKWNADAIALSLSTKKLAVAMGATKEDAENLLTETDECIDHHVEQTISNSIEELSQLLDKRDELKKMAKKIAKLKEHDIPHAQKKNPPDADLEKRLQNELSELEQTYATESPAYSKDLIAASQRVSAHDGNGQIFEGIKSMRISHANFFLNIMKLERLVAQDDGKSELDAQFKQYNHKAPIVSTSTTRISNPPSVSIPTSSEPPGLAYREQQQQQYVYPPPPPPVVASSFTPITSPVAPKPTNFNSSSVEVTKPTPPPPPPPGLTARSSKSFKMFTISSSSSSSSKNKGGGGGGGGGGSTATTTTIATAHPGSVLKRNGSLARRLEGILSGNNKESKDSHDSSSLAPAPKALDASVQNAIQSQLGGGKANYEKYTKMRKIGLADEAIRHAIIRDGLDPEAFF